MDVGEAAGLVPELAVGQIRGDAPSRPSQRSATLSRRRPGVAIDRFVRDVESAAGQPIERNTASGPSEAGHSSE